jgi:membrane protein DedA with SNARE-associated domain
MEQSLQLINDFLDRLFVYGPLLIYLTLFMASFIENLFPPFPGDFFTLTGGALAASGRLNIFAVFAAVYLGGLASIIVIYYLGANLGRDFFMQKDYKVFSKNDIHRMEDWFQKRGATLLIFNRFIVGARSIIALVTGISRYNPVKAFTFISISFWLFNGVLLFSAYIFVVNFDTIIHYFRLYEKIVWSIIILAIIIVVIVKVRKMRKNGR